MFSTNDNGVTWTGQNNGLPVCNITQVFYVDSVMYLSTWGDGIFFFYRQWGYHGHH
ncbi:MAG: hypothetical protein IPK10_04070 [Bacteroidetes bacterium]|nr:hypothetical protein [Bacteroidota bacterium]